MVRVHADPFGYGHQRNLEQHAAGVGVNDRSLQGTLATGEELVELLELFARKQSAHPVAGAQLGQTAGRVGVAGPGEERQ